VAAFSVFGYLLEGRRPDLSPGYAKRLFALRGILSWGGLGVGIATCVTGAWLLREGLKSGHLARGWAVTIYAIVCAASIVLPALVMSVPELLGGPSQAAFSGEAGWTVLGVLFFMFIAAVLAFFLFCLMGTRDQNP
jgi:hypothetical protein